MKKLRVYITIGAPGSGKSTWAKKWLAVDPTSRVRVCPDDNRAVLGTGEGDQSVSYAAFCMAKDQMKNALDSGKDVVFDATNMYRKARRDFINIARGRGAEVAAMVFECNKETLMARNQKRGSEGGRVVPEDVIDNMLAKYQRPDVEEFDEVKFVK